MPYPTKLATCSYCGARTLLKPTARDGHELACGSCGAPLHDMKWLKSPSPTLEAKPAKPSKPAKQKKPKRPAQLADWSAAPKPRKKPKKRKSLFSKVLDEAWDVVEDIFD